MSYIKNFFIVLGLFLLSQVGMLSFGLIKGVSLNSGEAHLTSLELTAVLAIIVASIVLLMWLAKKLAICDFNFNWISKKNLLIIGGGYLLGRVVAIVGTSLVYMQSGQETTANDAAINTLFSGENPLLIFMLIAISAPITEEIVFRGGIIGLLFKDLPIVGVIVSVLTFGYLHMATSILEFLIYASLGLIMALAYYKTKRLEVAIGIHFLNNGLAALAMILLGMV